MKAVDALRQCDEAGRGYATAWVIPAGVRCRRACYRGPVRPLLKSSAIGLSASLTLSTEATSRRSNYYTV